MLSASAAKALKPKSKQFKAFDEKGLFLLVKPSGSKLWHFKYHFEGREQSISFGRYPEVSLKQAREYRDEARRQIASGLNPSAVRKADKLAATNTFEHIAEEWLEKKKDEWSDATYKKAQDTLRRKAIPYIGRRPLMDIQPPDVLALLRRIEGRGHHESAHRCKGRIGEVFRYAIATGRCERDPTADLRGALKAVTTTSRAAITEPAKVPALLIAIDQYQGLATVRAALQMLALTFVRPGELRFAEWSEFDRDANLWRIPAKRMKAKRDHLVPLTRQSIRVLEELRLLTGDRRFVFESARKGRPLSENAFNTALTTMGYGKGVMTAHGFRSLASSLLHEKGWPPEVIELQLAHKQRDQVAAAYNRSARLDDRRRMMATWANYLDELRGNPSET